VGLQALAGPEPVDLLRGPLAGATAASLNVVVKGLEAVLWPALDRWNLRRLASEQLALPEFPQRLDLPPVLHRPFPDPLGGEYGEDELGAVFENIKEGLRRTADERLEFDVDSAVVIRTRRPDQDEDVIGWKLSKTTSGIELLRGGAAEFVRDLKAKEGKAGSGPLVLLKFSNGGRLTRSRTSPVGSTSWSGTTPSLRRRALHPRRRTSSWGFPGQGKMPRRRRAVEGRVGKRQALRRCASRRADLPLAQATTSALVPLWGTQEAAEKAVEPGSGPVARDRVGGPAEQAGSGGRVGKRAKNHPRRRSNHSPSPWSAPTTVLPGTHCIFLTKSLKIVASTE
jgi:hypothetical protein